MVPQISPGVAAAWLRDGEAVLLDVREAPELDPGPCRLALEGDRRHRSGAQAGRHETAHQ